MLPADSNRQSLPAASPAICSNSATIDPYPTETVRTNFPHRFVRVVLPTNQRCELAGFQVPSDLTYAARVPSQGSLQLPGTFDRGNYYFSSKKNAAQNLKAFGSHCFCRSRSATLEDIVMSTQPASDGRSFNELNAPGDARNCLLSDFHALSDKNPADVAKHIKDFQAGDGRGVPTDFPDANQIMIAGINEHNPRIEARPGVPFDGAVKGAAVRARDISFDTMRPDVMVRFDRSHDVNQLADLRRRNGDEWRNGRVHIADNDAGNDLHLREGKPHPEIRRDGKKDDPNCKDGDKNEDPNCKDGEIKIDDPSFRDRKKNDDPNCKDDDKKKNDDPNCKDTEEKPKNDEPKCEEPKVEEPKRQNEARSAKNRR